MSMTKNAIISKIARQTGSDKDEIRMHVDLFIHHIGMELAKSKQVKIKRFGTWTVADDGAVLCEAAPDLVRRASLEDVLHGVAREVTESLAMRMPNIDGQDAAQQA